VGARIAGFVRKHTYDRSNNNNTGNPRRSLAPNVAWIAALWPHIVAAQVVSVENSHGDGSFFECPTGWMKRSEGRLGSDTGWPKPARPVVPMANRTAKRPAAIRAADIFSRVASSESL
jgi:hypothetical protein